MIEGDVGAEGTVTARDLRPAAATSPRHALVGASTRTDGGWDWEADELAAETRAELGQLREERAVLLARVTELEASRAAAAKREAALRDSLRRFADAGWRGRRRLAAELRAAGLLTE